MSLALTVPRGCRRRILATHFASPLRANLALDAASSSTQAVVWVPGIGAASLDEDDDDSSSDEELEENAWRDSARRRTDAAGGGRGGAGGVVVCQIIRNGLRYMAPVTRDSAYRRASGCSGRRDR